MKIEAKREQLLRPISQIIGAAADKPTLPIMSHVRIKAQSGIVTFTTTDLELEMSAEVAIPSSTIGLSTIPAKKLLGVLRALPADSSVTLTIEDTKAVLRSGRSRFSLLTLPEQDFPVRAPIDNAETITVRQSDLKRLIAKTQSAIANQDVRYYLNGLFLEIGKNCLKTIATDGHRLAYSEIEIARDSETPQGVIIPRRGVFELFKLLNGEEEITLSFNDRHIQAILGNVSFSTHLIDGKFPDYTRVIPQAHDKHAIVTPDLFKQAVQKTSAINAKPEDGIRMHLTNGALRLTASNTSAEEAEDELDVDYNGDPITIRVNPAYLLAAISGLDDDEIDIAVLDATSSLLLTNKNNTATKHVIMPMRI